MNRFLWPLIGFIALVALLAIGLNLNPRDVPSPLVGKPAPDFTLPQLLADGKATDKTFNPSDYKGKVWLLNVWASWCVSCRQEHPLLVELGKQNIVPIVGFNYKEVRGDGGIDVPADPNAEMQLARERASAWLRDHGNPYTLSVLDINGRVGIDYGVYGVPETYVIDKMGVIRHKQTGPITPDALQKTILPLIAELNK
jgi:cytochrome c biogenesis protein CcmG/thiol:disulfide interchange protein DsbE